MKEYPEVVRGQEYKDADPRMNGRLLTVLSVDLQQKTVGRFKARYTYATCVTSNGGKVKIDTDRLKSSAYKLVSGPASEENVPAACPIPSSAPAAA